MIIPVNNKWRIESDENNWIVSRYGGKRKNPKTGKMDDRWDFVSFHGTSEAAMNSLFRRGVREIQSDVPEEIMELAKSLKEDIQSVLRRLDAV